MAEHGTFHSQAEWAKERLHEMDAALASLERQAGETQAASRAKADQLIADLRKRRNEFHQVMETHLQAGEAAWRRERARLQGQWDGFAAELVEYLVAFGNRVDQRQAMFRDLAAAQCKAWHHAGEQLHDAAAEFAAERQADIQSAVKQMKSDASKAEARLQRLITAGNESWAALNTALKESRAAFDHAVAVAGEAFDIAAAHRAGKTPNRRTPRH